MMDKNIQNEISEFLSYFDINSSEFNTKYVSECIRKIITNAIDKKEYINNILRYKKIHKLKYECSKRNKRT